MANKKVELFILDISPSMKNVLAGEKSSSLTQAQFILHNFIHSKLVAERKTDHTGLVLVGTDETINDLSEDGYSHVTMQGTIGVATLSLLKFIHDEIPESHTAGDIMDGFIVAVDAIAKHCKHYKYEKKIYILTNAEGSINQDGVDDVVKQCTSAGIVVDVIGFGFDDPESEVKFPRKSPLQLANEKFLRSFAELCAGDTYLGSEAVSLLSKLRSKSVKPTTLIRAPLTLGDPSDASKALQIPVYLYAKTMEMKLPSAKKHSAIAELATGAERKTMDVVMDRVYKLAVPELSDIDGVNEPDEKDDGTTTFSVDDLIRGHKYGKTIVPFSKDDEDSLKLRTEKGLSVLAFPKRDQIRREWFMGNTLLMVAEPDNTTAAKKFSIFLRGLQESGCVALVRYVFRDNTNPKLGVLFPPAKGMGVVDDAENEELMSYGIWVQMPYADDIRDYTFPGFIGLVGDGTASNSQASTTTGGGRPSVSTNSSIARSSQTSTLPSSAASSTFSQMMAKRNKKIDRRKVPPNEAIQIVDAFIEAMDISTEDEPVFNPGSQRMYQCIAHRAMYPNDDLPPQDERFLKGILPNENVIVNATPIMERLKTAFQIEKLEKKATKRTWAPSEAEPVNFDALLDGSQANDGGEKRVRIDDAELSIEGITEAGVEKVGTVDPVGDFEKILKRRDGDFVNDALNQMSQIITKLVTESLGDSLYGKAILCVSALRKHSIIEGEVEFFNNWIKLFRENTLSQARYASFWKRIVTGNITLINEAEGRGGVPKTEADKFIEPEEEKAAEESVQVAEEEDEEDLLAMLE
ncbi:X-ray repair cross-complementing protein 5 [Nowakowskiella sp. JEL0407]|nr:X-ray repair cross-complementing protein 5 [Nowakowskiella sp. JEL0407]